MAARPEIVVTAKSNGRESLEAAQLGQRTTREGLFYALPWVKQYGFRRNGWGMIICAALPCIPAMFVPHLVFRFGETHGGGPPIVVAQCIQWLWVVACAGFTLLFGAAGVVGIVKGGRCFIWLSPNGIQTIHFRGGELRTSWFALSELKQLAVRDVAGEPVLVAIGEKEVKRMADDYSPELLAALATSIAEWINSRGHNATTSRQF
jgi:hypothetical protein